MDGITNTDHSAAASALLRVMSIPEQDLEEATMLDLESNAQFESHSRNRRHTLTPSMVNRTTGESNRNSFIAAEPMPRMHRRGTASNMHTKRNIRPTDSLAYIIHALDKCDVEGNSIGKDDRRHSSIPTSRMSLQQLNIKSMPAYRSTPRMGMRNLPSRTPFVSPPKTGNESQEIQHRMDSSTCVSIRSSSTVEERLISATQPIFSEAKPRVPSVRWHDSPTVLNKYRADPSPVCTPAADMTVKFPSEMLTVREHVWRRFPHIENTYLGMGDEQYHASSMPLVDRWSQQVEYYPVTSPLQISDMALWDDNMSAIERQIAVPLQMEPNSKTKSVSDMDKERQKETLAPLIITRIKGAGSPSIAQILSLHYNKEGKCSEEVRLQLALSESAAMPSRASTCGQGDTFGSHPQELSRRRSLDEKISSIRVALQTRRTQRRGCHLFFYSLMMWFRRRQYQPDSNPLFASHIRTIEGQFGSGVASLFIFTRWLLLLNIFLCLLWSALVILPQAVHYNYDQINDVFYMRNVIDGQNAVAQTWLFFGNYVGHVGNYPLALLYIIAILVTFFGSFLMVLRSTAKTIHHGGGIYSSEFKFSSLILSSWDYSLKSHDGATNLTTGIVKTLREAARNEGFVGGVEVTPKHKDPLVLFLSRMTAWVITTVLIGGAVAAIFQLVIADLSPLVTALGQEATEDNFIVVYTPIVCFMLINFIVPHCIYLLPRLEQYTDIGQELRVTIGRVFVLRMANLAALVFSFHRKIQAGDFKGCAGTLVGQELYKLVLLYTVCQALLMLVWRFAKFYWRGAKQECDITALVLVVIYRQALIWLGAVVVPPMPLLGIISMATIFLSNYVVVCYTCRPLERNWNQPRHNTFFMTLTAVTLAILICLGTVVSSQVLELGYVGNERDVSCGPFGNKTIHGVIQSYVQQLHLKDIPYVGTVLNTVMSAAVVFPGVFILLAVLYFMYRRISWEQSQRRIAQAELKEERKAKRELARRRNTTDSYGTAC